MSDHYEWVAAGEASTWVHSKGSEIGYDILAADIALQIGSPDGDGIILTGNHLEMMRLLSVAMEMVIQDLKDQRQE